MTSASLADNDNSLFNMIKLIRLRQNDIKRTQDKMLGKIQQELQGKSAVELEELHNKWLSAVTLHLELIESYNQAGYFSDFKQVGFPVKFHKTHLQLAMLKNYIESCAEKGEDIFADLQEGKLYNHLTNEIDPNALPMLGAGQDKFYGNENASNSSLMLYSLSNVLGFELADNIFSGAITFYPFLNGYSLDSRQVCDNPYVKSSGIYLFGDYQFGGYKDSSYPTLELRPHDCSSAVAEATNLTKEQVEAIWTGALKSAYKEKNNEYSYESVTSTTDAQGLDLTKVSTGDIFVKGGHSAIVEKVSVATDSISTVEFNRNIDPELQNKILGGGTRHYDLSQEKLGANDVWFLHPQNAPSAEFADANIEQLLGEIDHTCLQDFALSD